MADISTKMSVTGLSQYKSAMSQAQASVKTLDAELKKNEAAYKASGDKEKYMEERTKLLNDRMKAQKAAAQQAEQALKAMRDQGVDPASTSYQKMQQALLAAQTGALETTASLNELAQGAQTAAAGADTLTTSVNGINKKVSLDAVSNGIANIKAGLESVASKAAEVGKALWDELLDRAKWADDTATAAQMYGIDLTTYMQMLKVFENGQDTTVDAILLGQSRLKKGIGNDTKAVSEALSELGVSMYEWQTVAGQSGSKAVMKDSVDLFWEAGKAILAMNDEMKQEAYAQALFGKSWRDLVPLFKGFKNREEYEETLKNTTTNSEEAVNKLADLNDKLGQLESSFDTLKGEVLQGLAPSLSKAAETLSGLLDSITEYLQTPEGQQALADMEKAVSGLFDDLGEIDPEEVVAGFSKVFTDIVGGIQWLVDNEGTASNILKTIVGAWGLVTLTGGALQVLQLINGIRGLGSAGAAAAAGQAGATVGSAWGGAFATAAKTAIAGGLSLYLANEIIKDLPANLTTVLLEKMGIKTPEPVKTVEDIQAEVLGETVGEQGKAQLKMAAATGTNPLQKIFDWVNSSTPRSAQHESSGGEVHGGGGRHFGSDNEPIEVPVKPVLEPDSNFKDELLAWMDEHNPMRGARHSGPGRKRNIVGQAEHIGSGNDPWPKETIEPADLSIQPMLPTGYSIFPDLFNGDILGGKWGTVGEFFELPVKPVMADDDEDIDIWDLVENGEPVDMPVKPVLPDDDEDIDIWDLLEDPVPMPTDPEVDVESAQEQLNSAGATMPVTPVINWGPSRWGSTGGGGAGKDGYIASHANGLPFVPWDGYLAMLHRGERVLTASANANYTYNSNTYFGNVNLNNGLEIDALSESIARQNKKHQAGYGS